MRYVLSVAAFLAAVFQTVQASASAAPETKVSVKGCSRKAETSFAIITDSRTYENCSAEIQEYKEVLESEGLGTYVAYADWTSPDQVRETILKLSRRKPVLEGVVLLGDIPIVMVREAQYMTTAFKMNEVTWPEFESSVASDRFYDDFDLKFEFIKRDSLRNDVFYYRLSEQGSQTLRPDIYSARMKVPGVMEGDKYEIMRAYLKKVCDAHRNAGVLDRMRYFAGHGYNSDCLTLWRQKPVAFRENFPFCFSSSEANSFLNFRQDDAMKYNLFTELQRPGTDFFMFSEHGAYDTQYINGNSRAEGLDECVGRLKGKVASMFRKYKGTPDQEPFIHEVLDSLFHLDRAMLSDSSLADFAFRDSVRAAGIDISLNDIMSVRSNPRVIVFNACYNGSFHREDGYVAGCHVFGSGDCVVAQGNTVNVLQDKWEDKLIGYLSIGERIGMWQREQPYLESHLIGDPTFRFLPHNEAERDALESLHRNLTVGKPAEGYWKSLLRSDIPVLRSTAVTRLASGKANSAVIYDIFCNDPAVTVRLHALHALALLKDTNFRKAVEKGLEDSSEGIVRTSCRLASSMGDTTLIPALRTAAGRMDMVRVSDFVAPDAIAILSGEKGRGQVAAAADTSLAEKKRMNAVRSFRNDRVSAAVPVLLSIAGSDGEPESLRKAACEALGWYSCHLVAGEIVGELSSMLRKSGEGMPVQVRKEMIKTVKRLSE
ncbi:MAG: hypothetical protein ACI395_10105 [Candidatus Cryptobacteroides sp.]